MIGMGWYRPEDWDRVLQVISDRDALHDSYGEWLASATEAEQIIRAQGHSVRRVFVDPDEFAAWCLIRGLSPNGEARASFVSDRSQTAERKRPAGAP